MEGGKQGYSLCARLGITSEFRAFVFVFFKTGQRGCTRIDHGPGMDERNADDIGMPRMHAPYCQVGFLHIHRMKGSHAVERNEGYVTDM